MKYEININFIFFDILGKWQFGIEWNQNSKYIDCFGKSYESIIIENGYRIENRKKCLLDGTKINWYQIISKMSKSVELEVN